MASCSFDEIEHLFICIKMQDCLIMNLVTAQKNNFRSFRRRGDFMIIDPHVHIGHDTTFESNRTEDEVYNKMKEVGINAAIIQPAIRNI